MSVNLDKAPELSPALIDELGCHEILIRIPMSDIKNIAKYADFAASFSKKQILFVLMPTRQQITSPSRLKVDIYTVFTTLSPYSERFVIGNAINRLKWGFVMPKEYLLFFQTVTQVRESHFPYIKLIGPSVIDFEYYITIRTLFNLYKLKYDAFSTLLYVDRRGAPENKQGIFNLMGKINLMRSIISLTPKKRSDTLYITETNYPIKGMRPYSPTSDFEAVQEDEYIFYMVRYYLLALATTQVTSVYWHQMIAPGYGLINNLDGFRKRDAFYAYQTMVKLLSDEQFIAYKQKEDLHILTFSNTIALWSTRSSFYTTPLEYKRFDILGNPLDDLERFEVGDAVQYLIRENR
jgi:hypothetical protein